jgi:uncharacterized membrane protein
MEELIGRLANYISLAVDAAAILIVAFGALEAFVRIVDLMVKPRTPHGHRKEVWRCFGMWLVLGLEFELAADIISSVVSPSWQDVGKLGAIAVIRTFLNYFLGLDLEKATASSSAVATTDPEGGQRPAPPSRS